MSRKIGVIISGGGTGGHVFPAISIANAIKEITPNADILFVGAENRMEMSYVPKAGYSIKGLPIIGFDRKNLLKNIKVLFRVLQSQILARKIIIQFKPNVVVGVGGYASGPTLRMAGRLGIPILIQEQNSFAGITNKLLAGKANKICVAYDGMERFFPKDKIIVTGNPVRQTLLENRYTREQAALELKLDVTKKSVLILGGSLGAKALNDSVMANLDLIRLTHNVQFLWQTGKYYYNDVMSALRNVEEVANLFPIDFISDMEMVYKATDLIISRAGAGSISEFSLLKKAVILVPSPNVAEDHQTKNAMALVNKGAAIHIPDSEAKERLISFAINLVTDNVRLDNLRDNIAQMAVAGSAHRIATEVLKLIK